MHMAAIKQPLGFLHSDTSSTSSFPLSSRRTIITASIHLPKINMSNLGVFAPKIASNIDYVEEMKNFPRLTPNNPISNPRVYLGDEVMEKLYMILEAVSNRVEMHKNIGEQRSTWNNLMLISINTITLAAATMAGIAAATTTVPGGAPLEFLKITSSFMYLAATGMLVIMNKIQPSQLAEEQRNAARLFKQLESEIKTKIAIGHPKLIHVNEAMEKVLAIDRAYPLPLIGVMLEKFPAKTKPAVWWPKKRRTSPAKQKKDKNGWSMELNKGLAIAGPLLTGLGAVGSSFLASSHWAMALGVMAGAMASVVNTVQHGGQVGMVFEMYRSNAGFFKMMQESIESNLCWNM